MSEPSVSVEDRAVGSAEVPDLDCAVCAHSYGDHDGIAARYCAATHDGGLARGCICRGKAVGAG
jgi:hypothetical protein